MLNEMQYCYHLLNGFFVQQLKLDPFQTNKQTNRGKNAHVIKNDKISNKKIIDTQALTNQDINDAYYNHINICIVLMKINIYLCSCIHSQIVCMKIYYEMSKFVEKRRGTICLF